mgnify:CR=1 FL=1
MNKSLKEFEEILEYSFKDKGLLNRALTHKSYNNDKNNEKLEFLGDRVLGLCISKKLLEIFPNEKEGILDKKLASLVNKNKCYEIGKQLKLDKFLKIGNLRQKKHVIEKKIISDSCEALIGAIYLDKGFDYTEKFILKIWKSFISTSNVLEIDSKTKLQEYSLKKYKSLPIYKLISNTGPRHKPKFKVAVKLKNFDYIEATGNSKKDAEQSAAKAFLNVINEK